MQRNSFPYYPVIPHLTYVTQAGDTYKGKDEVIPLQAWCGLEGG